MWHLPTPWYGSLAILFHVPVSRHWRDSKPRSILLPLTVWDQPGIRYTDSAMPAQLQFILISIFYYRPQRSCGQGNIFTPVCHSVHRGVCLRQNPLGADTPPPPGADIPWVRHPLGAYNPPGSRHPRQQTPPQAHSSIWSTSGRYSSYWNEFLSISYIRYQCGSEHRDFNFLNIIWSRLEYF